MAGQSVKSQSGPGRPPSYAVCFAHRQPQRQRRDGARNLFHGMHNAHDVGYVSDGYNLGPFGNECLDIFDTDRAVRRRGIYFSVAPTAIAASPRYEITVMLHFRQDDFIGTANGARVGRCYQIQGRRRTTGENNLFRTLGINETGNLLPGSFISIGSTVAECMNPRCTLEFSHS